MIESRLKIKESLIADQNPDINEVFKIEFREGYDILKQIFENPPE